MGRLEWWCRWLEGGDRGTERGFGAAGQGQRAREVEGVLSGVAVGLRSGGQRRVEIQAEERLGIAIEDGVAT